MYLWSMAKASDFCKLIFLNKENEIIL